uniref:Uncharacterized protein n=1 Tax=Anguilla anguilla TaxID=7936 RepID=A0A0E9QA64_ANGAN
MLDSMVQSSRPAANVENYYNSFEKPFCANGFHRAKLFCVRFSINP